MARGIWDQYRFKRPGPKETPMAITSFSGIGYKAPATDSQTAWSFAQSRQLQLYVEQRLSVNEICQKMNRSVTAVRLQAEALGLNLNPK